MPAQAFLFPEFQTSLIGHQSVDEFSPIVLAEAPEALRAMPEGEIEEKIAEQVSIISEIEMSGILTAKLIEPDATPTIAANTEYIALGEQIAELEKEVSQPIAATEDDFLREGRDSLTVGIDALKSRLMKREQIEKNNQRIAELEAAHQKTE